MSTTNVDTKAGARAAADEAIAELGGPVEAARKLADEATYQSVQSWRASGVPARWCRKVSDLTGISVKRLRPDDWQDYWPELATEKEGA